MIRRAVVVQKTAGLDARPIAVMVQKASQFSSMVHIEVGNKKINAKSIMGMMSLNVGGGEQVVIVTEGADEVAAAEELELYLSND